jgi:hypothetical protein
MEIDAAEQLAKTLNNLKPLLGNDEVTDLQKYQAIAKSGLSEREQWTAFKAQTPAKWTNYFAKFDIFKEQGIAPSTWVQFRQASLSVDNGDGNINDEEAKAALDGMNIPDWQKAILWQTQDARYGKNKNPYDRQLGRMIHDQMKELKASYENTDTAASGGLTLGSWGQYSISATPQKDTTPASTGLSLGSW